MKKEVTIFQLLYKSGQKVLIAAHKIEWRKHLGTVQQLSIEPPPVSYIDEINRNAKFADRIVISACEVITELVHISTYGFSHYLQK